MCVRVHACMRMCAIFIQTINHFLEYLFLIFYKLVSIAVGKFCFPRLGSFSLISPWGISCFTKLCLTRWKKTWQQQETSSAPKSEKAMIQALK